MAQYEKILLKKTIKNMLDDLNTADKVEDVSNSEDSA